MPTELHWDDAEDLGILLAEKFLTRIHSRCASPTCTSASSSSQRSMTILKPPTKASSKLSKWPGTRSGKTATPDPAG
jgi:hypothetical protein